MCKGGYQLAEGGHLFTLYQLCLGSLELLKQLRQLLILCPQLNVPQAVDFRFVPAPLSLKTDLEIANLGASLFAENLLAKTMEDPCMLQSTRQLAISFANF